MKTVNINGKDYQIKQTVRSLFLWEQIAGRPFEVKTTLDNYLYYYCLILANNKECDLDWDAFLDAIDNDLSIIIEITKALADLSKLEKMLDSGEKEADGKKKDLP